MKAKLLKRIRKQYSIVRYDYIGSDATEFEVFASREVGLPFYILFEDGYSFGCLNVWDKEKQPLIDTILKRVRKKWRTKLKPTKTKCQQVWP